MSLPLEAKITWRGVLPAITTPFDAELKIEHAAVQQHVRWLIDNGCTGIVPHGSLGESATLSFEEKGALQRSCVAAAAGRVPVIPGIAALSTSEAVACCHRVPWLVFMKCWPARSRPAHQKVIVSSPSALPLEARQAAWDALWRRLLSDPPQDPGPDESEDHEGDDEAA